MKYLFFVAFLFFHMNVFAQNDPVKIDSLSKCLEQNGIHDTTRATLYLELADQLFYSNLDTLKSLSQMALDLADKNLKSKKISKNEKNTWFVISGSALSNIGSYESTQGNMDEAMEYFKKSISIIEKSNARINLVTSLMNYGIMSKVIGDQKSAIEYFFKALKVAEKVKYYYGMGSANNLIGTTYAEQGKSDMGYGYYKKAKKYFLKSGDEQGVAQANGNIANYLNGKGELEKSKELFLENLALYSKIGSPFGVSVSYINLGQIELLDGNLKEAEKYFLEGLKIIGEHYNPSSIADAYLGLAELCLVKGEVKKTILYAEKAIENSRAAKDLDKTRTAADLLFNAYRKMGDYKNSLEMHLLYTSLADSVTGLDIERKLFQKETEYEYETKKYKDSLEHAAESELKKEELARQEVEISAQKNKLYFSIGGLILIFVFAFVLFNRLKISQRQKKIIEHQKHEVESQKELLEEKNKEITDSINYAKRIQEAILPSRYSLSENLKNGFVLFKPKDIVSGDFYWLEKVDGKLFFAAADCTGHGVPGAMVSVICSNALSKALLEENIRMPGELLDRTRELVIQKFEKSGEEVKDGMDISLCELNYATRKLNWAGANNPLWILRHGEILEFKADKQPVGKSPIQVPFTTHSIDLAEGDIVYIFTDGYQDQFGGPKGKKFKATQLKELLIANGNHTLEKQRESIFNEFEKWRGDLEQVDDVCIIGVRI